jgi:hypothetical protein
MTLKSILIDYLPTKWCRAIAGTTVALAGSELTLPLILPSSIVATWDKEELMLLAIVILSTLLSGTFLTLLLTVIAYHKKIKEIAAAKNDKAKEKVMATVEKAADKFLEQQINHKPLDETAIKILLHLWKQQDKITDKEISQALSIDFQIVKYHLEGLEKQNMVHGTLAIGQPREWSLIQGGREYLIKNNLIS